jgi:hypothetical protein
VLTAVKRAGQRIAQDEADAARAAGMMAMDPAALSKEDAAWLRAWMENPDRRRIAKGAGEYERLEDVNAALRGLRKEIGDEMFDRLDQVAAGPFQQAADRAVRALVEAGVVSEEAYAAMKAANDFYAPYKIIHEAELSHWGDSIPKGGRLPVSDSTIKAMTGIDNPDFHIDDPLGVLAEKIFGARVVAERNTAMRRLAAYAAQNGAEDFARPVKPGMRAQAGMAKVAYFENGVKRHLAVNERIFNAISGLNGAQANIFLDTVGQFNRVFRAGATGLRLPFATWNLARDQYRFSTMSRYGALRGGEGNAALETARLGMDFTHALYISAFARQARTAGTGAAAGIAGGAMQEADSPWERLGNMAIGGAAGAAAGFGANRAAGAAGRALRGRGGALGAAGRALDAETLYREYAMSGAGGSVLMDKLSNPRSAGVSELGRGAMKPVRGVIGSFGEFAKALEETTKIQSFRRGMRQEGLTGAGAKDLAPAEFQRRLERVVAETRNYGGSPDFDKAGSLLREANYVIPFLNARVQGAGQDIARLAGRDGAKQAALSWAANLTTAGLGATALWFYLQEPENARDYEHAQRHERMDKYAWIPRTDAEGRPLYLTNERGEKKREALRIPLSETYGMFTKGVFNALDFLKERDPEALKRLGDAFADYASPINVSGGTARERMESIIGSAGPVANVPYTIATGREAGLHRDLLPTPQNSIGDR